MLRNTFFVFSLIIMLLGINCRQVQAQAEFIIPASTYTLSSEAGTFTDIADNPATVKLGTDLADNTALLNGFFVNAATDNFVTHTADKTKTDPGFPLGFTFNLCGKKMTYFTICASGGIHFGQSAEIPQAQSAAWFTMSANYNNLVTLSVTAGGKTNAMTTLNGQAPAMYLIEGEAGAKVLTVQYDYNVNGDEWVYQLKAYEADGRIEMVVKDLATAHASEKTPYRMFLGLVENGNSSIPDEPFALMNLNYCREYDVSRGAHKIGFRQFSAADWSTFSAYVTQGGTEGMYLSTTNKPAEGHTLAFHPYTCPATPGLEADRYAFSLNSISKTSITGQVAYTSAVTPAELSASGTVLAILSTSETPDYTLTDGTWYRQGDKIGSMTVLANAKPTYNIAIKTATGDTIMSGDRYLKLSADNLTEGTTYYIHIYSMSYQCLTSPTYSGLCQTFRFTSSIDLPQKLSAGLPTTSSVPVTVQAAGDGFGVVLLKSPNANPVTLNGKLTEGQEIDGTKVLKIINSATETKIDVPLEAGEGAYLLAFSAINLDSDAPTYASDFLSLPVRAAYNGLPVTLSFEKETGRDAPQSGYPDLPCGWSREIELDADHQPFAFGITRDEFNDRIYLQSSYNYEESKNQWIDVITPAFVAHKKLVRTTFFISATENVQGELEPQPHEFTAKDQIRLEYALKAGNGWQDWQEVVLLSGGSDNFPKADANGYYPIQGTIENLQEDDMIRLRYSYKMPAAGMVHNRIQRVELLEGRECATPVSLRPVDSLTTATSLTLQWQDDDLQQAPYFIVAHGPAGTDKTQWHYQRVRSSEATGYTLRDLDRGTAYAAKVAAICGTEDTSFYTQAITTRTAFLPPYRESMAITESGETPFNRGVQALSGNFGGPLTEAPYGWNQTTTSATNETPVRTVAVGDFTANAWLVLPPVYIRPDIVVPMSFSFSLSSFDDDKHKGVAPQRPGIQLQVLVSDNGRFYSQNSVLALSGGSLAADDSVVTVDLTGKTGCLQVALLFISPHAENTEYADLAPWYLEVSDCRLDFDVDVCFPVENLKRRLLVGEVPLTWDASPAAIEYGVFWGDEKAEGYSDSVFVKENCYTITKFAGDFRHKAMVIAYCSEDRSLKSDPVSTSFTPNLPDAPCPTPTDLHYINLVAQSVDFVSSVEPEAGVTGRLVYLWETSTDSEARIFAQASDTLPLHSVLNPQTAYVATTRAVCASDTSEMSDELQFTTPGKTQDTSANEAIAQLSALFSLSSQNGEILVRNKQQLRIETVSIFNLSGQLLHEFRVNSRGDLHLPVAENRRMLFVRLRTEQGICVHKLYHR